MPNVIEAEIKNRITAFVTELDALVRKSVSVRAGLAVGSLPA